MPCCWCVTECCILWKENRPHFFAVFHLLFYGLFAADRPVCIARYGLSCSTARANIWESSLVHFALKTKVECPPDFCACVTLAVHLAIVTDQHCNCVTVTIRIGPLGSYLSAGTVYLRRLACEHHAHACFPALLFRVGLTRTTSASLRRTAARPS
jgi:hypothetical protein